MGIYSDKMIWITHEWKLHIAPSEFAGKANLVLHFPASDYRHYGLYNGDEVRWDPAPRLGLPDGLLEAVYAVCQEFNKSWGFGKKDVVS